MKKSSVTVAALVMLFGLTEQSNPSPTPAPSISPDVKQVTRVSQDEPVISPDGTKILFQSDFDGPSNLFTMDRDGTHIIRITNHPGSDDGGIWSPNGKQIAFSSMDRKSGVSEIFVIAADGTNEQQITHDRAFNIHPAWSPDGRSIMYTSTKESKDPQYGKADVWQTYVVGADGRNPRRLAVPGPVNTYASWSPDGSKILMRRKATNDSRVSDVYSMNADGTGLKQLTDGKEYNRYPSWSPTGDQIVFTSERSGCFQILLMKADGTNVRVLVDGPGTLTAPRFSPDGKLVFYSRDFEQEVKVFCVGIKP